MRDNSVHITGRATEPELRYSGSGTPFVVFAVGLYEGKNDDGTYKDSSWVDVVAFGDMAELVAESVRKGDRVMVSGRLTQDRWEDKTDGSARTKLKVVADEVGLGVRFDAAHSEKIEVSGATRTNRAPAPKVQSGGEAPF